MSRMYSICELSKTYHSKEDAAFFIKMRWAVDAKSQQSYKPIKFTDRTVEYPKGLAWMVWENTGDKLRFEKLEENLTSKIQQSAINGKIQFIYLNGVDNHPVPADVFLNPNDFQIDWMGSEIIHHGEHGKRVVYNVIGYIKDESVDEKAYDWAIQNIQKSKRLKDKDGNLILIEALELLKANKIGLQDALFDAATSFFEAAREGVDVKVRKQRDEAVVRLLYTLKNQIRDGRRAAKTSQTTH